MTTGIDDAERALTAAEEAMARLDIDALVAHLSTAVRAFTAAGDKRQAAMASARLGDTYANAMGNLTASRAWFARAVRLVEDEPPCIEQGWVAVAAMGCDVDDPDTLLAAADLALERARRFGDVNLETKALADGGLALVQAGLVAQGMARLDEAMALACGPADDGDAAAKSVCSFFTACYYTADFARADSWADALRRHGLIGPAPGGPVFLSNHCDSVQATMLMELGRWSEAEGLLLRAKGDFEAAMAMPSWHADIALADLRVRQGRLAEAEALLLGKDHWVQALLPAARLHLARGEHELARAAALRGLRAIGTDRLRAVELMTTLVDTELARGDVAAATATCGDLSVRLSGVEVPSLLARAAAARARVQLANGDAAGAIETLESTIDGLDPERLPWLRATLLVDLARARCEAGDETAARRDAAGAAALLGDLDVVPAPGDLALVERLTRTEPRAARARGATLVRDATWWVASFEGTTVRLRDTKGMRYLAVLLARPGAECHALDLVDRVEGVDPRGGIDRRALGDAGEVLDARARSAYRHRVETLRTEIDDAVATGRLETAERLQAEVDELVGQLAQAFGLGGRERRAASAAERARLNVTRALRTAIATLCEALPEPGAALDRGVRTGLYCAYAPDPGEPVRWIVHRVMNGPGPD